jgi:hypothetical protein
MDLNTHHKIYPPLPINVVKAVVWGGRPNSVCGLSFGCFCGRTINDKLNFLLRHSNSTSINNVKDMKTHHKNIATPACCCWQGGGVGHDTKLSLWAEFWPFQW